MDAYPLWDLFSVCGKVQVWQEGLYICFRATMEGDRSGFYHLHHSLGERVLQLALFCPEDGSMTAKGKISLRLLGQNWKNGSFTLHNVSAVPLQEPLDGGFLPPKAILVQKNGRRFVLIEHKDSLPQEIMPYFCFLTPANFCGTDCLGFEIDGEGKPLFSDVMPE